MNDYEEILKNRVKVIQGIFEDKGKVSVEVMEVEDEIVGIIRYKEHENDDKILTFVDFVFYYDNEDNRHNFNLCYFSSPPIPSDVIIVASKYRIKDIKKGLALVSFYYYILSRGIVLR